MQNTKYTTTIVLACFVGLFAVGCKTKPDEEVVAEPQLPPCALGEQKRVGPAMDTAKRKLLDAQCRSRLGQYYEELIEIAASNPGPENYELFSDFITWAFNQNMLSSIEAKKMFTEYFSTTFTALSTNQNVCEASTDTATLQQELALELEKKQRGLAIALGDRGKYDQAMRQMTEVLHIIESVGEACEGA